jgi:hypothetical protein
MFGQGGRQPTSQSDFQALVRGLEDDLNTVLISEVPWLVESNPLDRTSLQIKIIEPGNEFRLYAGREFREARFGLLRGHESSAAQCARVLRDFASFLANYDVPIAYLHYPHGWKRYGDDRWSWLRVAYAVDRSVGTDAATEAGAWDLADNEGIPLSIYDPTTPAGDMSSRFTVINKAPETVRPVELSPADRIGLCIEGIARVGVVAEVLRGVEGLRIYGCTMSVMYGHTVCNLITDRGGSDALSEALSGELSVVRRDVDRRSPVVARPGAERAQFWVAWYCPESPGVMYNVIRRIYRTFESSGAHRPNIHYAISRVLADGYSCAGKIKFLCDRDDADRVGLADRRATREGPGSEGWDQLEAAVRSSIGDVPSDWAPSQRRWAERPVRVSESEPHEEPWAILVAPEGAELGMWS